MKTFKTKVECSDSKKEYTFECYDNTETIEIGEYFLFFFGGIADIGKCQSVSEQSEINQHNRDKRHDVIDLTHGFWKQCYKIKTTDFDLNNYLNDF